MLNRYPDGCPDRIVANALGLSSEELEELYNDIVTKLRRKMKTDDR